MLFHASDDVKPKLRVANIHLPRWKRSRVECSFVMEAILKGLNDATGGMMIKNANCDIDETKSAVCHSHFAVSNMILHGAPSKERM